MSVHRQPLPVPFEGGTRARILVIEDDPVVRFNIVSFLEDSGFAVDEQEDGAAGMRAIGEMPPDLVLCDLRMPGLDGLDVLERLRVDRPGLPVVVVSGTGVLGDAVEALRMGAADFVTKPIQDMVVLEHAIDGALEKAFLQRENERFQAELELANSELRRHIEQLEQDAIAGHKLQQQLMPPAERIIGGYRFQRHLLPSLHLSGDFVDYFVIDATHVGFYLADVSGHGVSSAFVTVLLKSMIDRHLGRYQDEGDDLILAPARLLARLNEDMLAQQFDKYLTIFYGVIDTADHRLTFCNGGHFPTPLLYDGRTTRFIEQRGFAVGMLGAADFEQSTLELPDYHRLVIFSDGMLDALPEQWLDDKRSRLLDAVGHTRGELEPLLAALGVAPDAAHPDDITLLIAGCGD